MRSALYLLGALLIFASLGANVYAGVPPITPPPVPEINPGMITSGLGLLAGGAMILRARFGRK